MYRDLFRVVGLGIGGAAGESIIFVFIYQMRYIIIMRPHVREYNLDLLKKHPFWADREELLDQIRELRPQTLEGNTENNKRLDILEGRASELLQIMTIDLGFSDPRRDDPLWQEYSQCFERAQAANYAGDAEGIRNAWAAIGVASEHIVEKYGMSGD